MKSLLLLVICTIFLTNAYAQPEDKGGGGGGLPFSEKHSSLWNSFNKEKQKDILNVHQLNTDFFKNFQTNWKGCFGNEKAPESLIQLYINFTVKRQLKTLEIREQFDHKCTNREQRHERRALRKEKRDEKCIFQGDNKKLMKDFFKSSNSKIYLELRYDISKEDAEKMALFFQELL